MAEIPVLKLYLHQEHIGTLTHLPGDKNFFAFNQEYIENLQRPTLSLSFKDTYGLLITNIRPTQTRLPPFFSNLLPEGPMREYLSEKAGVNSKREFFLLGALGQDLPGAVKIIFEDEREQTPPMEQDEKASNKKMEGSSVMRFSLAGVQLKFSAIKEANGGLTIPVNGVGGSWIVKLPSAKHDGVPENEYAMMELASQVGINVPETKLVPTGEIEGLPKGTADVGEYAYAIKRFDRTENGGSIHIEDFAQIFGVYPEDKYKTASYRNIAEVIWAEIGERGIVEFIRRLVFNVLIGNADMHLKNWSFIYPNKKNPELAPAYDFVSTIQYIPEDKLALNFVDSKAFESIDSDQVLRFAGKARLPEKLILDTAKETVENFAEVWHSTKDLSMPAETKKAIATHLKKIPLWKSK